MTEFYNKDWRTLRIGVYDTETTGLNPKDERLVEIGIVVFEGGKPVEKYNRLINPEGRKISAGASKVSGITDKMVDKKKPFSKRAKKIKKVFKSCDVLCAFNETFDRSFVGAEFKRAGVKFKFKPTLDPRIFADHLWPQGPNNLDAVTQRLRLTLDLGDSCKRLDIDKSRHRADYDALLTGFALMKLAHRLPKSLRQTLAVQDWMYRDWLLFRKQGKPRYARVLDPIMPPEYND